MKKKNLSKKDNLVLHDISSLWTFLGKNNFRLFSILILFLYFFIQPGLNYYSTLKLEFRPTEVRATEFDSFKPGNYPLKVTNDSLPRLTAEGLAITDLDSMALMFELNSQIRMKPASITKLLTALVALEHYNLDDVLTVDSLAAFPAASIMGLSVGDKVSVDTLLKGLLIPSGNDVAYVLANNYEGGMDGFVEAMNQKAKELGMKNSHFENPSGIDGSNHYSTPRDITFLTSVALKNPTILDIVKTKQTVVADITGKRIYRLKNVNQLLGTVAGVDGVKTGFTTEAGQCLVTSATRNGHKIVIVLMGSADRFGESAKLVDWAFSNFQWFSFKELMSQSSN